MSDLAAYRQQVDRQLADLRHAERSAREEFQQLKKLKQQTVHAEKAREILQHTAQFVQQSAQEQIAKTVTHCLKTVFGEDAYEFRIRFERKRGKTEALLLFVTPNGHELHPSSAAGGGCIDIASFALRLSCLLLSTPQRRKLLIMDEPLRNLHGGENRRKVVELLKTLSRKLGIQMIVATGLDWLALAGKVVELE